MLARIDAYMPTASFVSRPRASASDGGALLLEYSPAVAAGTSQSKRQTLNPELLAEMFRGALLSLKDAGNTAKQSEVLDGFVLAYQAAAEVHSQRLHLESIGHPDYCGGSEEKMPQGATVRCVKRRVILLGMRLLAPSSRCRRRC